MAIVSGTDLRVYISGAAVAYATTSNLTLDAEITELAPTSVGAASFRRIEPRRMAGQIVTNALYGPADNYDFADLFDAWTNGTEVEVVFRTSTSGEWTYEASGYVTNLSLTATVEENASATATFTLNGEIVKGTY